MKIFVINGFPGAGKDTFVDFCIEAWEGVYQLWTSTPAKEAFKLLGWNGEKTPEARNGLAWTMDIAERLFDSSFSHIKKELEKIQKERSDAIVFIHCREPENIRRYEAVYDAESILIVREYKEYHSIEMEAKRFSNHADSNVNNHKYHHIVYNNSDFSVLRDKAVEFLERNDNGVGRCKYI